MREIAKELNKSPSSVSRELKRNSVYGQYSALKAHHKAYVKRKYSKYQGMKVRENPVIEEYVRKKMKRYWSPEQIAGTLKKNNGGITKVSYRGIYKYLYSKHGYQFCKYLKSQQYRIKKRGEKKTTRILIPNRILIDQRPDLINTRERFGDVEGDTMGRPKQASRQTLVVLRERVSRKVFAKKVPRLSSTIQGFTSLLKGIGALSLTLDNGVENARYETLGIPTYFCHPYSSWEKGSVEQGIGLIRRFIPKNADLKDYSHQQISVIINRINNTPMKCLDFRTPNEVFNEQLSLTTNP